MTRKFVGENWAKMSPAQVLLIDEAHDLFWMAEKSSIRRGISALQGEHTKTIALSGTLFFQSPFEKFTALKIVKAEGFAEMTEKRFEKEFLGVMHQGTGLNAPQTAIEVKILS
jgi:hypothetical protein